MDFQKRGGFLSEVDQASFIEIRNGKRYIHHRSTKFPSRTTLQELPDNQLLDEYDINAHIALLEAISDDVKEFEI